MIYRNELKYLLTPGDAELLKRRLGALLQRDPHAGADGRYKVRSVYFDDYWSNSYEEKLMGVASRKKYRIRVYGDSDTAIHLERKLKYGAYVSKQSARLSRKQAESLLNGEYGFLLKDPQPLCGEFYYECSSKLMRPRVTVDYEREAYIFGVGDVRVTFDTDVRVALFRFDLFDAGLPAINTLEAGRMILEVKYTELLPKFVRDALPQRASQALAASKFVLACDAFEGLFAF